MQLAEQTRVACDFGVLWTFFLCLEHFPSGEKIQNQIVNNKIIIIKKATCKSSTSTAVVKGLSYITSLKHTKPEQSE